MSIKEAYITLISEGLKSLNEDQLKNLHVLVENTLEQNREIEFRESSTKIAKMLSENPPDLKDIFTIPTTTKNEK